MKTRNGILVVALGLFVAGGLAVEAWACTAQANLRLVSGVAIPGGVAQVVGSGFVPGQPVEIRFNGSQGPLLATAAGPSFSTTITVPQDASPDVYYILASQVVTSFGVQRPFGGAAPLMVRSGKETAPPGNREKRGRAAQQAGSDLWVGLQRGNHLNGQPAASLNVAAPHRILLATGFGTIAAGLLTTVALLSLARTKKREANAPESS